MTIEKIYSGPEDETATGPNYPPRVHDYRRHCTRSIVTDLDVRDLIPNDVQFLSVLSTSPDITTSCITPGTTVPGGTLLCPFPSVTGTGGDERSLRSVLLPV